MASTAATTTPQLASQLIPDTDEHANQPPPPYTFSHHNNPFLHDFDDEDDEDEDEPASPPKQEIKLTINRPINISGRNNAVSANPMLDAAKLSVLLTQMLQGVDKSGERTSAEQDAAGRSPTAAAQNASPSTLVPSHEDQRTEPLCERHQPHHQIHQSSTELQPATHPPTDPPAQPSTRHTLAALTRLITTTVRAALPPTATTPPPARPQINLNLTINCGITIVGHGNVVGPMVVSPRSTAAAAAAGAATAAAVSSAAAGGEEAVLGAVNAGGEKVVVGVKRKAGEVE